MQRRPVVLGDLKMWFCHAPRSQFWLRSVRSRDPASDTAQVLLSRRPSLRLTSGRHGGRGLRLRVLSHFPWTA